MDIQWIHTFVGMSKLWIFNGVVWGIIWDLSWWERQHTFTYARSLPPKDGQQTLHIGIYGIFAFWVVPRFIFSNHQRHFTFPRDQHVAMEWLGNVKVPNIGKFGMVRTCSNTLLVMILRMHSKPHGGRKHTPYSSQSWQWQIIWFTVDVSIATFGFCTQKPWLPELHRLIHTSETT